MKKIIVSGEGGQGVRLISHTLATVLTNLGYYVTLLYNYDSAVRGSMSMAYLAYDAQPIDNPIFQTADILLRLSNKAQGLTAQKIVCDTGLCTDEEIPFGKLGVAAFGKDIFGNMIALGRLLRLINLEISDEELLQVLPLKYQQENLSAVHFGYELKEEDLGRGVDSTREREFAFTSSKPGDEAAGAPQA